MSYNLVSNMNTSENSEFKVYVENVLKLQRKYGWMMDSYVLDFFSDNLWDKLPGKWTEVLVDIQSDEIAYFLLEMYSLKFRQNSQKLKFRKVWPLELLAFIASCHALNLNYQRWVDTFNEKQLPRKNIVNKDTTCNSARATGHEANIFSSAKTVQEDVQQSDVEALHTDGTRNGHILQCPNLSHAFQCHIKPKKRYEIDVMSKVICEQAEKLKCWNIVYLLFDASVKDLVDVGAGLGHLSRLLSYGYKLRVVTIEGDGCHQSGAEKIDQKVLAYLEKGTETVDRSLVHITHHIKADISAAEFSNVVLRAFSKMEEGKQDITEVQERRRESSENFLIVGLHTCGDLAPTLLRVFSQCHNAVGIISIGCCYMKLSHKMAKTDQGTTAQNIKNKLGAASTQPCFSKVCGNLKEKSTKVTNLEEQRNTEFLHSSGGHNGTDICSNFEEKITENESLGSRQALTTSCEELTVVVNSSEDEKGVLGYPMSDHVQSLRDHRQTYNALESACHAIDRYHKKLLDVSPTLKLHYYRALLEFLLKQKDPCCSRRQIRTLKTKKAANMTFTEYVTSACNILNIKEFRPTSQDIQSAEDIHGGKQFDVVVFYVLRLLLAPVTEGLLLVDRLLYVKERHPDISSRISMLFDPDISPRNFAIIAEKLV